MAPDYNHNTMKPQLLFLATITILSIGCNQRRSSADSIATENAAADVVTYPVNHTLMTVIDDFINVSDSIFNRPRPIVQFALYEEDSESFLVIGDQYCYTDYAIIGHFIYRDRIIAVYKDSIFRYEWEPPTKIKPSRFYYDFIDTTKLNRKFPDNFTNIDTCYEPYNAIYKVISPDSVVLIKEIFP